MRRSLVKFSNPTAITIGKHTGSLSSHFSTSSDGGGGRGRGRGGGGGGGASSDVPNFPFAATTPEKFDSKADGEENASPSVPSGAGHGRGAIGIRDKPLHQPSVSFVSSDPGSKVVNAGRGRGGIGGTNTIQSTSNVPSQSSSSSPQDSGPKKPIFFLKIEEEEAAAGSKPAIVRKPDDSNLPSSILSVLTGFGRGKPISPSDGAGEVLIKQENRHLRPRQPGTSIRGRGTDRTVTPGQRLSPEEAVKNAMGILSKGGDGIDADRESGVERGLRGGRGSRGRGRGWRGRGRGRGGRIGRGESRRQQDLDDDYGSGLYLGDDADGEKLAKRLGADNMNKLVEGFEEMSGSVLPSPMDDSYIDALHTNYLIECEPEYLMEEFGTNPDIDEKPPIPLREALEKMKPFLMAYENIQSQEEWEEVMEETMERVPLIKEIVDYYSGPDRVTAKTQQEELERVANTLPESAPTSVKRFTERAVLSLQSNPGWGFDKKCQFMDKLVWEVSQQYK